MALLYRGSAPWTIDLKFTRTLLLINCARSRRRCASKPVRFPTKIKLDYFRYMNTLLLGKLAPNWAERAQNANCCGDDAWRLFYISNQNKKLLMYVLYTSTTYVSYRYTLILRTHTGTFFPILLRFFLGLIATTDFSTAVWILRRFLRELRTHPSFLPALMPINALVAGTFTPILFIDVIQVFNAL